MKKLDSSYNAEIDQIRKSEWEELLTRFDDATIYQTWSYGSVRWGEGNLSHIVLKNDGEVVAMAQARIVKLPVFRAGIAYIPWGPIWRKKGKERDLEDLRHIIQTLREEYVERRGLLLRIVPNIIKDKENKIPSILKDGGFQWKSYKPAYQTLLVDLTPSLEGLRKNMDQKWRNQLNRAEKNSLEIIEGDDDELYKVFLILQEEMLDRKEFVPGVDYNEFREIQRNLPGHIKMKIMVCKYEGEAVSSAICSTIGDRGIYLLGATGNKGLNLKGSYLLQWWMVKWLKEKGCRWYDLGGIDPERVPGTYHFKAGLSGKTGKDIQYIGEYEACENIASSLLVKIIDELRMPVQRAKLFFSKIGAFTK